ncbi:MAG TPA: hypothetical protein VGD97_03615 [Lacunisphaera sp.]
MKSKFIFDSGENMSPKILTTFPHLLRKDDIVQFGSRHYKIEDCSYSPEKNEATYWLLFGDDHHPTAPDES